MSRILGVDYGTRRVGLAISDGLGITARPMAVIARKGLEQELQRVLEGYEISLVVVGLPTGLSGDEGQSASEARALGAEIGEILSVDVTFVDERFTSRIAEQSLLESGMKRRDRRQKVDQVAAAIILQSYLDYRSSGNSASSHDVESAEPDDL